MPSAATPSNSCRSVNKALRIAPRSSSLRGATTAASRITVARRAAETVRPPRALIESATTRRFPGGIRRLTNFFLTNPSTNREVAGRDSPSQSDTAESEVPGWLWMKARVRNCGTDRSLPRWRRICARMNRIAAGTASRISAAQSVGEQARTIAVCNLCILPSSDKSTGPSSAPAAGQPRARRSLGQKGAPRPHSASTCAASPLRRLEAGVGISDDDDLSFVAHLREDQSPSRAGSRSRLTRIPRTAKTITA